MGTSDHQVSLTRRELCDSPQLICLRFRSLLSKRVIVTSCVDASLLSSVRCSNSALSAVEEHIMSYLRAPAIPSFSHQDLHFGFLLVDEAGQASEMELCVPLSVVAPGFAPVSKKALQLFDYPLVHITICGDVNQLGPRIESVECRNHDMDVSLLERLFERDPYRLSSFSRKTLRTRRGDVAMQVKQPISTPFCNLTKNYRSHPAILMLPSTLVGFTNACWQHILTCRLSFMKIPW